jgi:hypothetical protein
LLTYLSAFTKICCRSSRVSSDLCSKRNSFSLWCLKQYDEVVKFNELLRNHFFFFFDLVVFIFRMVSLRRSRCTKHSLSGKGDCRLIQPVWERNVSLTNNCFKYRRWLTLFMIF